MYALKSDAQAVVENPALPWPGAGTGPENYPPLEDAKGFRAYFEREGFILVRGKLPAGLCTEAVEAFRREVLPERFAYFERHASGRHERHVYTEAGFMKYPIMNLQDISRRRYPQFRRCGLDLLTQPAIQQAIRVLCGEPGHVVHTMYFDGNQHTWAHRDGHYIDARQPGRMIGVWVAAEDIDPDAGRFFVLPRSHTMPVPGEQGDPNGADYKTAMAHFVRHGPLECVAPVMRRGDFLLWSSLTIHGSLPTGNARCARRSFTAHYVPASQDFEWKVQAAGARRTVSVNGVEIALHRNDASLLARLRHGLRDELPRAYGLAQRIRQWIKPSAGALPRR
jgi:phytanoyl-CoA hydroxylase